MPRCCTFLIVSLSLLCILALTGMLAGFVPQHDGTLVRRGVSSHVAKPAEADMPAPILSLSNGLFVWAVREPVEQRPCDGKNSADTRQVEHIVSFDKNGVRLNMEREPVILEENSNHYAPLLTLEGMPQPLLAGIQSLAYGDVLDAAGRPVRWFAAESLLGYSPFRRMAPNEDSGDTNNDNDAFLHAKIQRYRNLIENSARRYELDLDLVYAIIYSESDFSPTLVSNKSAMGLMQLLPSTASDEVHRFLYGRPGLVGYDELRAPEINIRYGTAYLHILLSRYFGEVQNPDSREYCVIAAYNMGPNRFLRLFGKTPEEATENINAMGADELYTELTQRLPLRETRYYVAKVRRMKGTFAELRRPRN
jgi:membrane-bound lytic murein transglycosylase C